MEVERIMGIFDFFAKKENVQTTEIGSYFDGINRDLMEKIFDDVYDYLTSGMVFSRNDIKCLRAEGGVLENLVMRFKTETIYQIHRALDMEEYLIFCCKRAAGAGIYIAVEQQVFGKSIEKFSDMQKQKINSDLKETDPHILGLRMMKEDETSKRAHTILMAGLFAVRFAQDEVGEDILKEENLKALMWVMFNLGFFLYGK